MNKVELPLDGGIWILCGVIYVIACKIYNTILAGENDMISDIIIAKTIIIALISISVGSYVYNMYNSYTPSFSSMPTTTQVTAEPSTLQTHLRTPLRTPRIVRLVNS